MSSAAADSKVKMVEGRMREREGGRGCCIHDPDNNNHLLSAARQETKYGGVVVVVGDGGGGGNEISSISGVVTKPNGSGVVRRPS